MADNESEKTTRVGFMAFAAVVLGFFFLLSKENACALACNSCDTPSPPARPEVCKDEFYEIQSNNDRYPATHTCTPGARVEIVSSPPAPKPGIMCHCINNPPATDAGPATPPVKNPVN